MKELNNFREFLTEEMSDVQLTPEELRKEFYIGMDIMD